MNEVLSSEPEKRGLDSSSISGKDITRRDLMIFAAGAFLVGMGIGGFSESSRREHDMDEPSSSEDGVENPTLDTPENLSEFDLFMQKYESVAHEVQERYGVPYEVVLAMGMLESGYGTSELANGAFNFHGLKDNDEWGGDVYEKITTEHVSEDHLGDWKIIGDPVLVEDGVYQINTVAVFKKFAAAEDGFLGFGEHLRTRFGGDAYADAFVHTDPYEFVRSLFDSKGAKYATDVKYLEKIVGLLNKITGEDGELPAGDLEMPEWGDLNDFQKRQLGSREEYDKVVIQLRLADVTPKGFEEFKANSIVDVSSEAQMIDGYDEVFPSKDRFILSDHPRIVLHHTGWTNEQAWGHGWEKFFSSLVNSHRNGGGKVSANYYMDRTGCVFILTKGGQAAYHAGRKTDEYPFYNQESTGVEMPAGKQSDILPEMYASAAYLAAWQYQEGNPEKKPSREEMTKYIIGHGEIAEYTKGKVTTHNDFPRVVADAISYLTWQLLQKV